MIGFWIALVVMVALTIAAFVYRDKLAAILPGWKHAIVGALTAGGSFVLGIAQWLQALDLSPFVHNPKILLLITGGIGLLVYILSWATPRAK